MRMKSIYLLAAFLLLFVACKEDVEYGDGDPIILGKRTYEVGAEGGKLTIKLGGGFWYRECVRYTPLDTVKFISSFGPQKEIYSSDTISYENITVWGEKKKLNVEIGPNDLPFKKHFRLSIQSADRYEGIGITQERKKE